MPQNPWEKTRRFAASHQRSWLWGRHAVMETLAARHWPVIELLLDEELSPDVVRQVHDLVSATPLRFQRVSAKRLTDLCRSEEHQGFLARMSEFPCGSFDDLRSQLQACQRANECSERLTPQPLFVLCDCIQDAHNFGAILRCCDAMGVDGVVIGERFQVAVTPHVARASAGAVNHLSIFRVPSLSDALQEMKLGGLQAIAATEKSKIAAWTSNLKRPQVIVIGSEASGIDSSLLASCEVQIAIPMAGGIESLNAAVAAGIMLYEVRRQQALANSVGEGK